ncbi:MULTISPECIES: HAD family hydrolase [unclassified Mycoplasma]|uniref:HAD family hydrolase n=1 Tax=unclassified Mycoplasma TaxID=2683645 RepID=UPI00216B118E|nr:MULTISPECIES: HAD family hydrolase [unclassified Mycoplasma]MCS4536843.1 HAD family hydrolase [Mycoplasma sp. CSL7475-4]MCT4469682.1 HAD family hydrolase [Mycoplasma sp. HS2188]
MQPKDKITYFIDLDGTLFDQRGFSRISHRNLSAILILKNFANVVFSTGRSYSDFRVQQAMRQLNIHDIISSSGAEVYINRERVLANPICNETVQKIVDYAISKKILFMVYDATGEHIYVKNKIQRFLANITIKRWVKSINLFKDFDISKHKQITKIAFAFHTNLFSKKILKQIEKNFPNLTNSYTASRNYIIEITDITTNKAMATVEYCRINNIDLSNTVHIGDSMSDSCLKGYVGKLVAMGNSTPSLKSVADEIAPNHKNGGLYKYFVQNKVKKQ